MSSGLDAAIRCTAGCAIRWAARTRAAPRSSSADSRPAHRERGSRVRPARRTRPRGAGSGCRACPWHHRWPRYRSSWCRARHGTPVIEPRLENRESGAGHAHCLREIECRRPGSVEPMRCSQWPARGEATRPPRPPASRVRPPRWAPARESAGSRRHGRASTRASSSPTSRSTWDIGTPSASQIDASSSLLASFCPRSTSERYPSDTEPPPTLAQGAPLTLATPAQHRAEQPTQHDHGALPSLV